MVSNAIYVYIQFEDLVPLSSLSALVVQSKHSGLLNYIMDGCCSEFQFCWDDVMRVTKRYNQSPTEMRDFNSERCRMNKVVTRV